jgi:prefoldin subunit 5
VLPRKDSPRGKMRNMLEQPPGSPKPSWAPPENPTRTPPGNAGPRGKEIQAGKPSESEEGYSRFYSQIGTFLGRLPAPLAFTGLPLISEEAGSGEESIKQDQPPPTPPTPQAQTSPKRNRLRPLPSTTGSSDELSKYFSKPALRAIEHRSASDSFYVVPTSGHTMSYANILTFADKEKRRLEASSLHSGSASIEDDDDFVDAHESPTAMHSQAPQLSAPARRRVGKTRSEKDLHNAIEELCMENGSLKEMIDKLSKRLQAFEASSQRLAESRIMAQPGSPVAASSPDAMLRTNPELEERWNAAQQRIEMLEKDNDKMQRTLVKYRQKWDSLKESAKARRAQAPAGETSAQS